jgi:hypothetical protein
LVSHCGRRSGAEARCRNGLSATVAVGNRGGRLVADLVGVDDRHPRHQDHHGLTVLALLGPGDELVAPAHDLADVKKADQLELADDLLDRHLGALGPGAHDLRNAGQRDFVYVLDLARFQHRLLAIDGSRSFGPETVRDVLLSEPLTQRGINLRLMDIVADRLSDISRYAKSLGEKLGRSSEISTTTSLEAALDGAQLRRAFPA